MPKTIRITKFRVRYPDGKYTRPMHSFEEAKSMCEVFGGSIHRMVEYHDVMTVGEQIIHDTKIALRKTWKAIKI